MLVGKFQVDAVITEPEFPNQRKLRLSACTTDAGDSENWSKWTPSGRLELDITNEALFPRIDALKAGDLFRLSLTDFQAAA